MAWRLALVHNTHIFLSLNTTTPFQYLQYIQRTSNNLSYNSIASRTAFRSSDLIHHRYPLLKFQILTLLIRMSLILAPVVSKTSGPLH